MLGKDDIKIDKKRSGGPLRFQVGVSAYAFCFLSYVFVSFSVSVFSVSLVSL
jgi:hypothetical protein